MSACFCRIYSSFLVCAFRHAAKGIHPSRDANGIDIGPAHSLYEDHGRAIVAVGPRILRAVLVFAKGDLEFWANECGLPHWGSALPCGAREIVYFDLACFAIDANRVHTYCNM